MIIKVSTKQSYKPRINPQTGLKSTQTTCSKCECKRTGSFTITKRKQHQITAMAAKSLTELLGD
jgi:hypothetical protein